MLDESSLPLLLVLNVLPWQVAGVSWVVPTMGFGGVLLGALERHLGCWLVGWEDALAAAFSPHPSAPAHCSWT